MRVHYHGTMSTPDPAAPSSASGPATPATRATAPGDGERRAQRGYTRQYDAAAAAIYHGLDRGDLRWVGLADRCAGIADDVVLGYDGEVIGHQFKTARDPAPFRIKSLLTGSDGLLPGLVRAWQQLRASCPGQTVRIRVVVSDTPSDNDRLNEGGGTTRQFVEDWQTNPSRSLADWRMSLWRTFVEHLLTESHLGEQGFEEFLRHLELVHGDQPDFGTRFGITDQSRPQVDRIARRLPALVARVPEQDRWSREAFLRVMGWRDVETLHRHQFPVGAAVQRNPITENQLRLALNASPSGYVSLVGPPGSGKSTLLQIAFEAEPQLVVVRYLAFVPGVAQGIGRAEAADFQEDLIVGLRKTGLQGVRFRRESPQERREDLEALTYAAGARYRDTGVRTLIVVDGLDHVPREEHPERSFLSELPLPASIPEGVVFLLGTQRVDLAGMPPSVSDQSDMPERRVEMAPLSQVAISSMADLMGLPETVSRSRLRELAQGHPLATHYLIQALLAEADDAERARILQDGFEYAGDIETLYSSALRGLEDDDEVMNVLGVIARGEAPLELVQLEQFYPPAAIDRAWRSVRHLLVRSGGGWSIFHNSFRLFVARIPRSRYGVPDPDYSTRLYRQLAKIAEQASEGSPQRHLRLRYLMRAGAHQEVLALATPMMFREQFLAGRPSSSIRDDIRLAFHSLKGVRDATAAFRLIFASDELSRRVSAFEDSDETVKALLALGLLEEAESFLDETGGDGYPVVDAWLDQGNVERARSLFERIEPLHDLGSDTRSTNGPMAKQRELVKWAGRAVDFRTSAEIMAGVDRILEVARRNDDPFHDPADLGRALRESAAFATLRSKPTADVDALMADYRLEPATRVTLRFHAAWQLLAEATPEEAMTVIARVVAEKPELAEVSRDLRRGVSLEAARQGVIEGARSLAQGLPIPAIAEIDDSIDYDSAKHVTRAVMEHSELAGLLDSPVATSPLSRKHQLRPLQLFAENAGLLAARSRRAAHGVQVSEVAQECASFLRYVCRTGANGGGDYFAVSQLASAAPELLGSLLDSAARIGREEFARTIGAVDQILDDHPMVRDRQVPVEIMVARAVAQLGQDPDDAQRRLERLLDRRDENTPGQFLASTARLARAFARIGRRDRGRALLAEQRSHTLGYALRAKKDPQYAFWLTLMREANRVDPSRRPQRVRTLARQAMGMASTEGSDAAGRIAHGLVVEAAMDSAQLGWSVANALLEAGLIEFPEIVDALMTGTVRRDPQRLRPCIDTWVSLCLPFHRAAYYRESQEGDFIREAVRLAAPEELDRVGSLLLSNIEIHAQIDVRPSLIQSLRTALAERGADLERVETAAASLANDVPLNRSGGSTPTRYDDVQDMEVLASRLDADAASESVSFEVGQAFRRLVPTAEFGLALEVFDRHPKIQEDNRARFSLVDRALAAGQRDVASRLTAEYLIASDRSASWSWMMGGGRQRFFQARLQLEGQSVHDAAYLNFVSALASGEEATNALLWDVDDIWPVIERAPDWPGMWELVEEQLPQTRDYQLGHDVDFDQGMTDSGLLAKFFEQIITLPVSELQWQAERGALSLVQSDPGALLVLIGSLLAGSSDSIITGLRLLRSATNLAYRAELSPRVVELANHEDFGVSTLAVRLAEQWGSELVRERASLPTFYGLAFPPLDLPSREDSLRERPFGPPIVSDVAAWSAPFESLIERVASISDVSEDHIRRRVQQLVDGWGGVEAFGAPGVARLRATLSNLGLQLTYFYPHIIGALRAMRHVAGELDRAGRIGSEEVDALLREFGVSPEWKRAEVDRRPVFVRRPALPRSFRSDGEEWLSAVEEDVTDADTGSCTVLAEVTHFQGRASFTNYQWSRMRLFGVRLPAHQDPLMLFAGLPRSGMMVRRVVRAGFASVPSLELTLDAGLVEGLGWQAAGDGTSTWLDSQGALMATAYCWRDGGPDGQLHGDCLWGEGAAILLTEAGRAQLEAMVGTRFNAAVAKRSKSERDQHQERYACSPTGSAAS